MTDLHPFHTTSTLRRMRADREAEIDRLLSLIADVKRERDSLDASIRHREQSDAVLGKRVGRMLIMEGI